MFTGSLVCQWVLIACPFFSSLLIISYHITSPNTKHMYIYTHNHNLPPPTSHPIHIHQLSSLFPSRSFVSGLLLLSSSRDPPPPARLSFTVLSVCMFVYYYYSSFLSSSFFFSRSSTSCSVSIQRHVRIYVCMFVIVNYA